MKKVSITGKPDRSHQPKATSESAAEAWVAERRANGQEKMKRLTIDIPLNLHRQIKVQCALDGVKMADVIRDLLEERFGTTIQG